MNYAALLTAISDAHQQAQSGAAGAVNRHLILRNWLIGAYLIEFEQNGEDRAKYGAGLLKRVSADLRQTGVPGTSPDMLERMRNLYLYYPQLAGRISAPLVRKLPEARRGEAAIENSAPLVRNSGPPMPRPLPAAKLLELSWTHLADLVRLDDPWKRAFYENECLKGNWSKRQLQRQIGSLLYERTGLSTDKQTVIEHARQQAADAPTDIASLIRDPYVLEFTGQCFCQPFFGCREFSVAEWELVEDFDKEARDWRLPADVQAQMQNMNDHFGFTLRDFDFGRFWNDFDGSAFNPETGMPRLTATRSLSAKANAGWITVNRSGHKKAQTAQRRNATSDRLQLCGALVP